MEDKIAGIIFGVVLLIIIVLIIIVRIKKNKRRRKELEKDIQEPKEEIKENIEEKEEESLPELKFNLFGNKGNTSEEMFGNFKTEMKDKSKFFKELKSKINIEIKSNDGKIKDLNNQISETSKDVEKLINKLNVVDATINMYDKLKDYSNQEN